jgi:hypothetical protein
VTAGDSFVVPNGYVEGARNDSKPIGVLFGAQGVELGAGLDLDQYWRSFVGEAGAQPRADSLIVPKRHVDQKGGGSVTYSPELSPTTFPTFLREFSSRRGTPGVVLEELMRSQSSADLILMPSPPRSQPLDDHRLRDRHDERDHRN